MGHLRLVLFDVDGVLVDSLSAHLKICQDKSDQYGLGLSIPAVPQFRELVRRGTRISPMKQLFLAVGFPEQAAEAGTEDYRKTFRRDYPSAPYPGVGEMLRALRDAGFELGIVTGNVKANIAATLGDHLAFFRPDCVVSEDELAGASKDKGILLAMAALPTTAAETVFVGDQPADWQAAQAAGVHFLGVTYGWGITKNDNLFPSASSVAEVARHISETLSL